MKRAPVVVIGSNCFTGSHFVDALLEDPRNIVVGVSRSPEKGPLYLPYKARQGRDFQFHQIDLVRQAGALQALLDELQPAVVIHVAALSEVTLSNFRPAEYFQTNTLGVVTLCDFLRTRPYLKRYVHISSAEVYGPCERPVSESEPFRPSTPYAVSKAAADLYLATLVKNFGFPAVTIRSTNVYGRRQQLYKIIPRTVIAIKEGRKVQLHGGGKAIKSFVHIRDVVRGGLEAMRVGKPGDVYHFSDSKDQTTADVVRRIARRMGRRFEEIAEPARERLGEDSRYDLDCSKAKAELGWSPEVSLDQGIQEVIDWIEASWEEICAEPLAYVHKP
ncbi:MAG: GDP-mannose 4,6-dehydratase [Candidatus Omnitrophica bacterium]|nr:GDP-mannose 4,6-dehydratase [Candidatus Omnitrophota bacterium]